MLVLAIHFDEDAFVREKSVSLASVQSLDRGRQGTPADTLIERHRPAILKAAHLFGLHDISDLREHQLPAILHALNDENIFLSLRTGAGKSLCFQIPAVVRYQLLQQITVVIQPQLAVIQSHIQSLRGLIESIAVEELSGNITARQKQSLARRLQDGYRPTLLYTTPDTFFGTGFHSLFE